MKINCLNCLEPIEFGNDLANSAQKCPTCNNRIDVPAAKAESKPVSAQATLGARPSATRSDRAGEIHRAEVKTKDSSPKFSFRITGSVILMLLFFLTAVIVFGLAIAFYLQNFDTGLMVDIRDALFKWIGISGQSEYTVRLVGITLGTAALLGLLGLMALVAISKRKRILAIIALTLLVVSGFAVGAIPMVAILCLILVSVPGRSDVWTQRQLG